MNDHVVRLDSGGRQVSNRMPGGIGRSILVVHVTSQEVHNLLLVVLAEMLWVVEPLRSL